MRGSVKQRGATWCYVVDLGRDPVTKQRRQILKRGFATRKEAQDALSLVLAERVQTGSIVRPAKGTVAEYMTTWLAGKAASVRPTTHYAYSKVVNQRIIPGIGGVKLAELDAAALEAWYAGLLTAGGRNGRPLSAKTVANTAGVLTKALKDAVRLRKLRHNPAADVELPRRERPTMSAWTADEATAFLVASRGDRWLPMWRLALATGLRRGELLGLRWSDVDLGAGRLEVVETRVVAEREVVGRPKTRAGERLVGLDAETVAALRAWRKQVAADQLAAGEVWQDSGRVFVDEIGQPPHPETVTRWWGEACARAGVRPIRLHDARHTAATLALRAGVPVKVVSQRLGHADVAVTMRVYQHVTAQDDQLAADTLGRLLGGDRA